MMISPERFLNLHIDKTYSELLAVRDELLESIRAFENHTYDPKLDWIMPSPDTVYQCNLEYLGKICELISKKYNQEFICEDDDDNDTPFIEVIRDYLGERGLVYDTSLVMEINNRRNGKKYTIQDNVRGMIYSMLTSQTKWHRIEPHLKEIDKLFFGYDPGMILAHEPEYFYKKSLELGKHYRQVAERCSCGFIDCGELDFEINPVDGLHYSKADHAKLGPVAAAWIRQMLE